MENQRTIRHTVSLSGVGLHSGHPSRISLSPAPVDHGILFRRKIHGYVETCQASIRNLRPMELCTVIGSNGFQVQTTEHVLSALWGMGIDNAVVEIDSEEVPAMDGSAAPFTRSIQHAGIVLQGRPRTYLKILEPIHLGSHLNRISILPAPFPKITYSIDYDHHLIQRQTYEHEWSAAAFQANIARARTFAFSHEVKDLWARGLGKGGSLDNAIVLTDAGIMNEGPLRYPDECVRHKILDIIGDMSLLGMRMIGHIVADRSGHTLNNQLVQTILDNPDSWTLLGYNEKRTLDSADLVCMGTGREHAVPLVANASF